MEIDTHDLAWAAGFIDGEGNFAVGYTAQYNHRVTLAATNTDLRPMYKLQTMFGGKISTHDPVNIEKKPWHRWIVRNSRAAKTAELLIPYLVLKHEHAKIIVEIYATTGRNGKPVSKELYQTREDLKQKLSFLNKRGRIA